MSKACEGGKGVKPSIQTLGQVLYSPSQYIIPVFQRNYRWEKPQWQKLWESLEEVESPNKTGNHFMGFLVLMPELAQPGQHTRFHVIDGQQRLATLSVLLLAVRDTARRLGQAELAEEIHQYYVVHPLKRGEEHFRVLPKTRDYDSYAALVSGGNVIAGRLSEAISFFEEQASNYIGNDPLRARALFNTVVQRLEFMCATLETEDAYNIFKSLNSTGVPLDSSDLIRNFVFMHVLPERHDEFDRMYWSPLEDRFAGAMGILDEEKFSRFFRDFLMTTGRYVPPRETFSTFEARYEATNFSPIELARELIEASNDYAAIIGARNDADPSVTQALRGLNAFESPTTYPLLLALFKLRRQAKLGSAELADAVNMLCSFILRRSVCVESSRGYGPIFVRGVLSLQDDPVAELRAYLYDRGWPSDQDFMSAFVRFPLYQQHYAKHVLVSLERHRDHKEPADVSEVQVEHILPQTLTTEWRIELGATNPEEVHAQWLHSPGNLTLSGYNVELRNHPFATKRQLYAQSNISLNRELARLDHWNAQTIQSRGEQLASDAAAIWKGPLAGSPNLATRPIAAGLHSRLNQAREARARGTKVSIRGARDEFRLSKEAYIWLLNNFIDHRPALLQDPYEKVQGRGQLYFARSPADLFPNSPHLARQPTFYQHLRDGWIANVHFDDRLKLKILADLAEIAGLKLGEDWTWEQDRAGAEAVEIEL
jgi:uncharacterized protein with ParB-like and HNH nuclease domain